MAAPSGALDDLEIYRTSEKPIELKGVNWSKWNPLRN